MKIKNVSLFVLLMFAASPVLADAAVTGAGAAQFASGAVLNGVSLSSMRFGIGVDITTDGTATGSFQGTLLGASRKIVVEGNVTSGSSSALAPTVLSGTCTIDLGDGTTMSAVPFTVTVLKDAKGTSVLALALGSTTLPNATVNAGSIKTQ
jgi:hypothetical protein